MTDKIITIYCFFEELLKALNHRDDPQARLSTAEVMTIAAVAAEFFTGNQQAALDFLSSHGYIAPFSKSRFNRRLHRLPEALWQLALLVLAQIHQKSNPKRVHIVDTFRGHLSRAGHLRQMTGVPQHPYPAVQTVSRRSVPRLLRQRVHASVNKKQYYFGASCKNRSYRSAVSFIR